MKLSKVKTTEGEEVYLLSDEVLGESVCLKELSVANLNRAFKALDEILESCE